jgi:hypothetical protein
MELLWANKISQLRRHRHLEFQAERSVLVRCEWDVFTPTLSFVLDNKQLDGFLLSFI